MAIYDTPMRRPRCFVFWLTRWSCEVLRMSKSKRKIRLFIYVCVLPASALWGLSAWLWRYKIRENYPNSKIFLRKSIRRCAKLFTGAFIAPAYKTPKGQWVQGRICKNNSINVEEVGTHRPIFSFLDSPCLRHIVLHNGSSCQLPDGKPNAPRSTSGYSAKRACILSGMSFPWDMILRKYLMMQRSR